MVSIVNKSLDEFLHKCLCTTHIHVHMHTSTHMQGCVTWSMIQMRTYNISSLLHLNLKIQPFTISSQAKYFLFLRKIIFITYRTLLKWKGIVCIPLCLFADYQICKSNLLLVLRNRSFFSGLRQVNIPQIIYLQCCQWTFALFQTTMKKVSKNILFLFFSVHLLSFLLRICVGV